MQVPGSLRNKRGDSCSSGIILHAGKIHCIDFEENKNRFFQLQLNDVNEPDLYPMRCDAALAYADERSASFDIFRLPAQLLSTPANKSATTAENCKECDFYKAFYKLVTLE